MQSNPDLTPTSNQSTLHTGEHIASIGFVVGQLTERLSSLEKALSASRQDLTRQSGPWFDLLKVVLGGWPALGLLFLVLFYSPLRAALDAIPAKVQAASEMGFAGISLKTTLSAEAVRSGITGLAATVPSLSGPGIDLLLRTATEHNGGLQFATGISGLVTTVSLPDDQTLNAIAELERAKLITSWIHTPEHGRLDGVDAIRTRLAAYRQDNPGTAVEPREGSIGWRLTRPTEVGKLDIPGAYWAPTELGTKAREIILRAVVTELTRSDWIGSRK